MTAHRCSAPGALRMLAFGALVASLSPVAAQPVSPQRWVQADDVRVRQGPGIEHKVIGQLSRGARLMLKATAEGGDFCLVEGEGQAGYVACRYLSASHVRRPRAGYDDVPADRRWIVGSAVNLRAAPSRDAQILERLARHRIVRLLPRAAEAGYCQVQPLDRQGADQGRSGFTACEFLAPEALFVDGMSGSAPPADLVKAFWTRPEWSRLHAYAAALSRRHLSPIEGPWPADPELERMKAHLARGVDGAPGPPWADWAQLQGLARAHDAALLENDKRELIDGSPGRELTPSQASAREAGGSIRTALGLEWSFHARTSAPWGDEARSLRLAQALALPAVRPSLWRSESQLAPPGDGVEALAWRFGGTYRTLTTPRKAHERGPPEPGEPHAASAGLYDMFSRIALLARPVQRVRLFRDGRLHSEASHARTEERLWHDVDGPMCEGWLPGFAFGDAEPNIWRFFDAPDGGGRAAVAKRASVAHLNPPGSLFAFYTPHPLPMRKAKVQSRSLTFDRVATGFARGTELSFDLDGDGHSDVVVVELVGLGAGDIERPGGTDDAWLRIAWVNINGAWKVFGHDAFGYGCGC